MEPLLPEVYDELIRESILYPTRITLYPIYFLANKFDLGGPAKEFTEILRKVQAEQADLVEDLSDLETIDD